MLISRTGGRVSEQTLIKLVEDEDGDWFVRRFAALQLGRQAAGRAGYLALRDRALWAANPLVRAAATSAIALLSDTQLRDLEPLLDDASPFVRETAKAALETWLAERGLAAEPQELELKGFDGVQPAYRVPASVPIAAAG